MRQNFIDTYNEEVKVGNESDLNLLITLLTQIVTDTAQMKQTLADIEARHADIKKLEQSIFELHEMFVDMANLVESQGEMIDRIEFHVGKAVEYVKAGTEDTRKALKLQREARKKKIMILICILITLVILVPMVASFIPGL